MALYKPHSVEIVSDIKEISKDTFRTIGRLDKASRKVSKILDRKIKALSSKKSNICDSVIETEILRKTIELISAEKLQIAVKNYDLIDQNIKIVDYEIAVLEKALLESGEQFSLDDALDANGSSDKGVNTSKKRKTAAAQAQGELNEPLYCICNRVSFGDMIACDNEECPIEWFHYPCVNLTRKPRNSWICPTCVYQRKKK
jgi:hypothetical protein